VYGGIMNEARATVAGMSAQTVDADIYAENKAELVTIGVSAAVGKEAGVGGSVGVALVQNKTVAEWLVGEAGSVSAQTASLRLQAQDTAAIDALVGNAAGGGTAAVGAALVHAHTMNETRATLRDVAVTATGAVSVLAGAETKIRALAAGGGLAGQVAVTGSAVSGLIKNAVVAEAAGAGRTLAAASLAVTATDESTIESLAGNVSGGMQAAVGGAFSNAVVMNQVTARLAGYDEATGAGAAEVRAQNASNIKTAAVTAGFAGT